MRACPQGGREDDGGKAGAWACGLWPDGKGMRAVGRFWGRLECYDVYGNSYLDFAEAASVMDIVYNCQKVRMPMHQMEKRWITGIGIYPWWSE